MSDVVGLCKCYDTRHRWLTRCYTICMLLHHNFSSDNFIKLLPRKCKQLRFLLWKSTWNNWSDKCYEFNVLTLYNSISKIALKLLNYWYYIPVMLQLVVITRRINCKIKKKIVMPIVDKCFWILLVLNVIFYEVDGNFT